MFSTLFSTALGFATKNLSILKYGAIAILAGIVLWYGYSVYSDYKGVQIENETLKGELVSTKKELEASLKVASENAEKVKNQEERHK